MDGGMNRGSDSGGFVGTYQTDGKALDLKKRDSEQKVCVFVCFCVCMLNLGCGEEWRTKDKEKDANGDGTQTCEEQRQQKGEARLRHSEHSHFSIQFNFSSVYVQSAKSQHTKAEVRINLRMNSSTQKVQNDLQLHRTSKLVKKETICMNI